MRVGECTTICPGDTEQNCGGTYRMNVYKVPIMAPMADMPDGTCYEDNASRLLPVYIGEFPNNEKSVCIVACKGYRYAGVQYARECFCGNDKPNRALLRVGPNECSMICPGNTEQICGGTFRMNVYKVV